MTEISASTLGRLDAKSTTSLHLKELIIKTILERSRISPLETDKALAKKVLAIAKENNYKIPFEFDEEAQALAKAIESKAAEALASDSGIMRLHDYHESIAASAARDDFCLAEAFAQAPICAHFFDAH